MRVEVVWDHPAAARASRTPRNVTASSRESDPQLARGSPRARTRSLHCLALLGGVRRGPGACEGGIGHEAQEERAEETETA